MSFPVKRLAVLNVVGLTASVIKQMPKLQTWMEGRRLMTFSPEFPALTCTAQSTYLTGASPEQHGIVGNGWYQRQMAEIQFWKQSNHLVEGTKIWDVLKEEWGGHFSCAQLFWWYNMYANVDWSITPRPMYPADGRKVFDIYTQPMDLKYALKSDLGEFPFPYFWGPKAGLPSTDWIARSAQWVEDRKSPTLTFVYLPHLDYSFQKWGPHHVEAEKEVQALDSVLIDLLTYYDKRGVEVVILSEYGISPVETPIYLNRIFRKKGWIAIKEELGKEMLDAGASKVFAVADHQVAHIYVQDPSLKEEVRALVESLADVDELRSKSEGNTSAGYAMRCGDFIAVAKEKAWFSYYYWEEDDRAPDFARCIDIHRKPGYDPVELFLDPKLCCPMAKVVLFLLKKKLGFRALMEVIPLDADLVKGSHGRDHVSEEYKPVWIAPPSLSEVYEPKDVYSMIHKFFLMQRDLS